MPCLWYCLYKKKTVPKAWHREAEFKKPTVVGVKTPTSPAFTVVAAGMPLLLGLIFNTTHFLNDFLKKNSFQDLALKLVSIYKHNLIL